MRQHPTIRGLADHIRGMMDPKECADSQQLLPGISRRFLSGAASSTQRLLTAARTFRESRLLALLAAEDPRLPRRFGMRPAPTLAGLATSSAMAPVLRLRRTRIPYGAYLALQYLLLVLVQSAMLVGWAVMLVLLALTWRGMGSWWPILLWTPIAAVEIFVSAFLSTVLTWALLPRGIKPGEWACRAGRSRQQAALTRRNAAGYPSPPGSAPTSPMLLLA